MAKKPPKEYDPNILRPSEMSDAIVLQNYPNIWRPLIKKLKERGELDPDFSFLNDTRVVMWLTGNDPKTGELVNRLLINEACAEYFEWYEVHLSMKTKEALWRITLPPIKWEKRPEVGYVIAINYFGKWMGAFDLTANVPKKSETK